MTPEQWELNWSDPSYSPLWWVDGAHACVVRAVEDGWLTRGSHVLELGCGAGQQAAWLQSQGFNILATDVSAPAIERARRDYGALDGLNFDVLDVTAPNALDRSFEGIVDVGCLHSISPSNHPAYVRNVTTWSKSGTRFLLMVQCRDYRPIDRERQIKLLFTTSFELSDCELRTDALPRAPDLPVIIFRFVRRS